MKNAQYQEARGRRRSPPPSASPRWRPAAARTARRRPAAADPAPRPSPWSATTRSPPPTPVLKAFTAADRLHRQGPQERGRRRRPQPGDPHQGLPARRRLLRRRQHPALARPRQRHLHAVRRPRAWTRSPADVQLDKDKHRVTPIDTGDICVNYDKKYFADKKLAPPQSFDDLIKPEYKNLLVTENVATSSPGLGFMLGYGRQVRRRRLAGLLEEAEGQRRQGRRRLGAGLQRRTSPARPAARRPRATGRWSSRTPPARPPRCIYADPQADRGPDRRRHRHLLPPDRVRGLLNGAKNEAGRQGAPRLPDLQEVPGGHAAPDVRGPGAPRTPRCPPEFTKFGAKITSSATVAPDKIATNRDQWVKSWSSLVLK